MGGNAWQLAAFIGKLDPNDREGAVSWLEKRGLINGDRNHPHAPITVDDLAHNKRLPVEFLESLRLRNVSDGVLIPYYLIDGSDAFDTASWREFPFADFDLVILDSLDSAVEGVGEQDSAKPSKAIAPLLDIAHRENGPAVLVLGNCIKTGAHSRGSGVIEDRADIVFEVRDATSFRPSGEKPMASAAQVSRTKTTKARPASVRISSGPVRQTGAGIDPKLKAFIDSVVAPILVRDFLAHRQSEKEIANGVQDMASFATASEVAP